MVQRTPRLPPELRRRELLDAARDVITDTGFDALSVEAVARRAGVTRPVIYDLFGDLDSLVMALLDREEQLALGPLLAIVVEIDELFLHCAKAFLRSSLWDTATWPGKGAVPSAGKLVKGQYQVPGPARAIDAALRRDGRVNQY